MPADLLQIWNLASCWRFLVGIIYFQQHANFFARDNRQAIAATKLSCNDMTRLVYVYVWVTFSLLRWFMLKWFLSKQYRPAHA